MTTQLLEPIPANSELIRTCRECGNTFELLPFKWAAQFIHVCPDCSERHAEQDQREAFLRSGSLRDEAWKRVCPVLFQDTEAHRLPHPTKLQYALRWQYGRKGLILHGTSGKGKSRIVWELLKREFLQGRSIASLSADFGYEYASKFAISAADAAKWIERHTIVDLLLLDDVFKTRMTDSVEQALFVIINSRTERGLPIIVTANDTGDTLAARLSEDRGVPLLRRLREFCDTISFD